MLPTFLLAVYKANKGDDTAFITNRHGLKNIHVTNNT